MLTVPHLTMTAADGFAVESLFGSWDDRPEKYFIKKETEQ